MATDDEEQTKFRLSVWIKRELQRRRLTQTELARQIGVSIDTVSAWVNAKHQPTVQNERKLRQAFARLPRVDEYSESDLIFPPLVYQGCRECAYRAQCGKRVRLGFPLMCEALSRRDLEWAKWARVLQYLVWWQEVEPELSIEELYGELG